MLKVWNLGLAAGTFALATFGTFVVRSGVLSSVHSFALSDIGPYFFGFLAVVLLGTGGLLFFRLPALRAEGRFDALLSREAGFLANNWLLLAIVAATFWGTIFPLLSEAFQGTQIAIGPQFYRQVNGPIFLGLLLLMGIGPLLAWRRTSRTSLVRNFRWTTLLGLGLVALLLPLLGLDLAWVAIACGACAFVLGAIATEFIRGVRVRTQGGTGWWAALVGLVRANRRRYGGYIVHAGVVLFAFGVIGSSFFQRSEDVNLRPGESRTLGRYTLIYNSLSDYRQAGYQATVATLTVQGATPVQLHAERRVYDGWEQQPVTGVAIGTTLPWLDDVYVLLTGWDDAQGATFRFFLNPLVSLLWAGGLLLLAGTAIAIWPAALPVRKAVQRATQTAREGSFADA